MSEINMIISKKLCTGCSACTAVCPQHAVSLLYGKDGFLYPDIQEDKCNHCNECLRVCPVQNKPPLCENMYFGFQADLEVRRSSTSGGAFRILAEKMLEHGGSVYGAAFNSKLQVKQYCAENREELLRLLKTKYVQADPQNCFNSVKEKLDRGEKVLFEGNPCLVEGLHSYLGTKRDNLLLVDHVCNGVPSPVFWMTYLDYLGKSDSLEKVTSFEFRGKQLANDGHTVSWHNGTTICTEEFLNNKWCRIYSKGISIREACLSCKWCTPNRISDITLGDFWGIERVKPEYNDGFGTSLIIVHTEKGKKAFDEICSTGKYFRTEENEILQPRLCTPVKDSILRKLFFREIEAAGGIENCDMATILKKYGA